jgi:hypothetical protein
VFAVVGPHSLAMLSDGFRDILGAPTAAYSSMIKDVIILKAWQGIPYIWW